MTRLVPLLSLACLAAIGATAYAMLGHDPTAAIGAPAADAPTAPRPAAEPLRAELLAARRTCDPAALDAALQRIAAAAAAEPSAAACHLLALAHLERVLLRSNLRGIAVGKPVHTKLPPEVTADLDAGLAAVARARELGDDSSELFRIEAGLCGNRITGLASALQWNQRIQEALQQAAARAADNPHLHVALGLRKLLVPKLLGQDPQQALQHFEFAARALGDDERPAVFAALANHLQQKRQQAIAWLEQAVARNPQNGFARVVLGRLRRGEADPFGRDVTAAEVAAAK